MRSHRCIGVSFLSPRNEAEADIWIGPTPELDRSWMTWGYREQRRSSYNQGFRTFGFEWNEKYLWTCRFDPLSSA
jgi:hypothetical protein